MLECVWDDAENKSMAEFHESILHLEVVLLTDVKDMDIAVQV